MIERPKFEPQRLESEREKDEGKIITLRFNEAELKNLEWAKQFLEQTKDGTTIKLVMEAGYNVLQSNLTGSIVGAIFKNKRNNRRNGVIDFE